MRKIRIADEEIGNIVPILLFSVLWYTSILSHWTLPFSPSLVIAILAGLLPLITVVRQVHRTYYYRKLRKQAILYGDKRKGTITGIVKKQVPYTTSKGHIRYRNYYYLKIDAYDSHTGVIQEIESQPYSKPIHHYIANTSVSVYTDQSGWKYYIEDIVWKQSKNEPDIFMMNDEFEERHYRNIFQYIYVLIILYMILRLFLR